MPGGGGGGLGFGPVGRVEEGRSGPFAATGALCFTLYISGVTEVYTRGVHVDVEVYTWTYTHTHV